jgi:hypothetical protein
MTAGGTWLDIQSVEADGRTSVRVRRYRRAAGTSAATAVLIAAPLTVADVKEASAKVSTAALEAALTETNARFTLNGRTLIDLDDAGVADSVIDLMVAQSYPDKFQVERRAETSLDQYPPPFLDASWGGFYGWGLGYPYYSWYPGYYGNYRYYYSPFGYAYSGLYLPYSYYDGPLVIDNGGGSGSGRPVESGGRVVNGVGYTRIREREAEDRGGASGGGSSGGTSSRGRLTPSGATMSGSGGSSGGSSGGGGGASSGGGGGDGGGGRTAQPR